MWAIEHYGVEPDLIVSGKSLGGGLPLAGVTGRAELMDAVHVGGLGGTFGGNPVCCAAALAVLDELSAPGFRERADQIAAAAAHAARRDRSAAADRRRGARARLDARARARRAQRATRRRRSRRPRARKGLILLSCGLYGNVLRLLPPLSATDEELERGLAILEEALGDAGSG